ncbi:MAG TPA: MFS transporter [Polyangiaceae bacterium]|nr:MFS transporter [Polyangiaceae bacterium]
MSNSTPVADKAPDKFHPSFWSANTTELFERGAYYAMASFVVIYLGRLGMGKYWPSTLNGLLWTLVYFLPILSGTIADHVGFKKSLALAFVLLTGGYFLMGAPVWVGGAQLAEKAGDAVTSPMWMAVVVAAGMILIGIGGSFVKPCISGTVQKTAGARATLAFAIFYMVINIGSLFGRGVSYVVRTQLGLPFIFAVSMASSVIALAVVLLTYREPPVAAEVAAKPKRSVGQILLDMFLVLRNPRFVLFLLVNSGFTFLYSQVYNVLPLYLEKVLEKKPPVDIYTMANPFVIVFFQLLVTKLFGKMKPIRSIVVGTLIIATAMLINIVPLYLAGGARALVAGALPLGSLFVVMTVALIAFGELFASARTYEYIGGLAPKGQEGLFLGYANLPMAIGSLTGGPVGAWIFNEVMCKGAVKNDQGLLELQPSQAATGWIILMVIGLVSAFSLWLYNRWITRTATSEA